MVGYTEHLRQARAATDAVFSTVQTPHMYDRPVAERHRLIFYIGHVEAFDWNQIGRWTLGEESFHPTFDRLFEAGIDPQVGTGPIDQPSDWPAMEEVLGYIRNCRARVDSLLARAPSDIVQMAIEHRLMHAETLSYLIHQMPYDSKHPFAESATPPSTTIPRLDGMVDVPGGLTTLGRSAEEGFGWDNEFQRYFVRIPPFRIGRYKVTNGDYLKFVEAGARAPHYWSRQNGAWYFRGMFALVPLPLDFPVYVTHTEASDYADWRGLTLPSEAQFQRVAYGGRSGEERDFPWGSERPAQVDGNFGFRHFDPIPVDATPASDSAFGAAQLVGNGWEWTSTVFSPFPGFAPAPTYPGYSQDFFDGHHYVLKGASPRTADRLLRRSFRNWFRPDYPYAYATFRCVEC